MIELLIYLVVSALIAFVVGLILFARWNYGVLEATGIPVVKPSFMLGSEPNMHSVVHHEEDMRRMKKYGRFWGFYEGRAPHVYISDPELVRLILVKDFEYFHDRRTFENGLGHELINEMLDILPGDKWRTVRTALTPALTTGKIRMMSEKIKEAVQDCVNHISGLCESKQLIDMKQVYTALTTDVIARCAFGTKVSAINDPENVFVRMVSKLNNDSEDPNFLLAWVVTFPILAKAVPFLSPEALDFFGKVLGNIMAERRKQKIQVNDLVDFFNELVDRTPTDEFKRLGITETTILCQAVLFLFAGFDTTATTLTMLTYRLANNPDKQKKLIEELDTVFARNNGKIDHDTLADLPYMSACINESLRMCPPLIRVERMCMKDWKNEEAGLVINKGTVVQVSNWSVNYNEKYWPEPEKFEPERFLDKENLNPYAFMSFGQGPRNCPGSRFAKEELNLALAMILKDFYFEAAPETKVQFKPGRTFLVQYQPVMINVVRRKK